MYSEIFSKKYDSKITSHIFFKKLTWFKFSNEKSEISHIQDKMHRYGLYSSYELIHYHLFSVSIILEKLIASPCSNE